MSRIIIRKSKEEDLPFLKRCLLDPSVIAYYPMSDEKEVDDALVTWKYYIKEGCAFTAVDAEDKPLGMANLYIHTFERLKKQSLFSIVVDRDMRGKGIGTSLLKELIRSAKEDFNVRLLHLEVYEGNPAYNLYVRLGFVEYARHKRFLKEADGTYMDKVNMQLILGD
jgi:RimJ/RimL family protein N-acetyltransferase